MKRHREKEGNLVEKGKLSPFERYLIDKLLKVDDICTICANCPPKDVDDLCGRWKDGGTDDLCYRGIRSQFEAQKQRGLI